LEHKTVLNHDFVYEVTLPHLLLFLLPYCLQ
jgi:hypothetical protein